MKVGYAGRFFILKVLTGGSLMLMITLTSTTLEDQTCPGQKKFYRRQVSLAHLLL